MRFHFSKINHNARGKATLDDMLAWFRAGLQELGHTVTWGDDLDRGAVNVLWENFRPGMADALRQSGLRYGIVATELPDGEGGFNWRTDDPWPLRYQAFPDVARGAAFIWSMSEEASDFYRNFAPCAFIELGFTDALVPSRDIVDAAPAVDFGFFGLRTPYRQQILEHLAKYCSVVWPDFLPNTDAVVRFIGATKIGINFRQSATWPVPSPTRLGRYLLGQRVLVSERTRTVTRQGALVQMAASSDADLVECCMAALASDHRRTAATAFERYRSEMPMRQIMEHVLDATLGDRCAQPDTPTRRVHLTALSADEPVLLDTQQGHNVVGIGGLFVVVPQALGPVDFMRIADLHAFAASTAGVFIADTLAAARAAIDRCVEPAAGTADAPIQP